MIDEYFCPPTLKAYMEETGCCDPNVDFRRLPMEKLEEIAEILDENLSTIKSRLYRSMKKLRIRLAEE